MRAVRRAQRAHRAHRAHRARLAHRHRPADHGFSAAPVFPLLTLRTTERVGGAHADRAIGQIAGAGPGGALRPTGIGILLTRHGVNVLGPALTAVSGLYLVLHRPQPDRSTQVAA